MQTILVSLVLCTWLLDFLSTTPFGDLLPPNSLFFAHPFTFLRRYIDVYGMHVAYTSEQTNAKRRANIADVRKRSEWRKAHGLGDEEAFGGWDAKDDSEVLGTMGREGPRAPSSRDVDASPVAVEEEPAVGEVVKEEVVHSDGEAQGARKKWLGIW